METFEFYFYNSEISTFREYSLEIEDTYQIYFANKKWKNLNKQNKIFKQNKFCLTIKILFK